MTDWILGAAALLSAGAAQGGALADSAATSPDWRIIPLREGVELRYLPLAVTLRDYPKQARRAGEEGTSLLNLQVDASGLIACSTARSSGSPALDEEACRLYHERGRFELRGSSEPVTVKAPVRWVLMD